MRKKTQTVMASEAPKASEMYSNVPRSMTLVPRRLFATCVAANAKNKNRKVPTYSPVKEIMSWRTLFGSHP